MSENVQKFRVFKATEISHVEIEREPQYEEEWVNGVENEKMFLTRFDKIFWNENVCAFSLPVRKTNAVVFDNGEVCATLISDQGQRADWAALSLFVKKCMRATEGLKREEGRNTLKYVDDLLICARVMITYNIYIVIRETGQFSSKGIINDFIGNLNRLTVSRRFTEQAV